VLQWLIATDGKNRLCQDAPLSGNEGKAQSVLRIQQAVGLRINRVDQHYSKVAGLSKVNPPFGGSGYSLYMGGQRLMRL
jgi:hypothetical protein